MSAPDSVAQRILAFNQGRDPQRLHLKYQAMARSAFAFFRGTCHLFWQDWSASQALAGPAVWACGDLHLENFGAFKGADRLEYFDINDFDESALAPCACDPARFLCSLPLAFGAAAREPCERFLDAFLAALRGGKAGAIERHGASGVVGRLLAQLEQRKRVDLLGKRTVMGASGRRLRIDEKHVLAATPEQRARAGGLVRLATASGEETLLRVLDVARRIAGTGSLGLERYVVLVEGKGSPEHNYLLDLKAAAASTLRASLSLQQPAWQNEAERIVWVQGQMQAVPPALLRAVVQEERSYVLRELQPREDRLDLDELARSARSLGETVECMGRLLGWAQLRASGRKGAANADELVDHARGPAWRAALLDFALAYAERARADFAAFATAWRDGFFDSQCEVLASSRDSAPAP